MKQKGRNLSTIEFTSSLGFDRRLASYDIRGSIAHCKMLVKCGIISHEEGKRIVKALNEIRQEIAKGKFRFRDSDEDIHMAIERRLMEKVGQVGGKLHTARSRNDQVSLDMRMYLRDESEEILQLITQLQKSIIKLSEKNINIVMPGFTHLQHAQPVLFSHHMMAYFFMLKRDKQRMQDSLKRLNILPLGAGALAGTSFPIDREFVARELGFSQVSENSIDTVSDRDFVLEFLSILSILMMHLSRLAEELVIWSSSEFSFVKLDESFCTGSSIMPQKRNPDVAELIRGKTGRVYGNLLALLTVMKGLPLSYNRDMQEDKERMFDSADTVKKALKILIPLVSSLEVVKEKMEEQVEVGYTNATDAADYLVRKGLPFRQAHSVVRRVILYALKKGRRLEELSLAELKRFSPFFAPDFFAAIDITRCVNSRRSFGGTSVHEVRKQIKRAKNEAL